MVEMSIFTDLALRFFYWILRFLLSLRYRIEVEGLSEISRDGKKGALFLPNHIAETDPLILLRVLWPKFRPRPIAVEHFYYQKGIRFCMDLVGTLPLPTMDVANQWKVRQVAKLKLKVLEGLEKGENFLIYPSGKLKRTPEERIGGASFIPEVLQEDPNVDMVLVRITGFWGSSFSCAFSGVSPDFGKVLWQGCKTLLKNGIFFAPRRKIKVELVVAPEDFPRKGEKKEINTWLEDWYNQNGPEPLKLVSTALWKNEVPEAAPTEIKKEEDVEIPKEIEEEILAHLAKISGTPKEEIAPNFHLVNDLGLDSIDVAQLYIFLEERFDVAGLSPGSLESVRDLFHALAGIAEGREQFEANEKKSKWPRDPLRPPPVLGKGETIPEAFLNTCDRMGKTTACADAVSGILSYQKLKRSALVLSLKIRQMPGDKIGVLLPSSVGAYVTILATLLAGKVPVMLNWTTGSRNLEHAAKVCGLETVISSYRFLARLQNGDMGKVDDLLVLLEEIRRTISFKEKLKGAFWSLYGANRILKKLPRLAKPEDPAVIIFTSGTETLPKGVPLSHRNILTNQKSALSCIALEPRDILYGVLPPFHSFGFSVTGLMPLLAGVKVCFGPDPTDAHALANDIEHWKATFFCCAPSFIQQLLRVARDEQLQTLRYVVTGAEKTPDAMFDAFEGKGIAVMEGYGISECSPIVTVGREGEPHRGVGKPVPGVELCVIDPESGHLIEQGQEGEICIFGSNVFGGYLGVDRDPFIQIDGKKWYRSGDRGYIEPDGTLILTGRLKRFVKIGGEMVSLGGLEEELIPLCQKEGWAPKQSDGPLLAVTARGWESEKPEIILFTTFALDLRDLNQKLKEAGHGRLVKIAEVRQLDEIPLTGTGKIGYRHLDNLLEQS